MVAIKVKRKKSGKAADFRKDSTLEGGGDHRPYPFY